MAVVAAMAVGVAGFGVGVAGTVGMAVGAAVGGWVGGVLARGTSVAAASATGCGDGGAIAVALAADCSTQAASASANAKKIIKRTNNSFFHTAARASSSLGPSIAQQRTRRWICLSGSGQPRARRPGDIGGIFSRFRQRLAA